ncbi:MAG: hypothetical protein NC935_08935 [Candidatus Omnitrophica bacterium]|nr:hypothetical protein [Candidatus Omnitrophota bacterium]
MKSIFKNQNLKLFLNQLEDKLKIYLVNKAPFFLPENVKELIVDFGPYLVILLIILKAPTLLAVFGLGVLVSPFAPFLGSLYMVSYGIRYIISMVVFGAVLVLEALAVPGFFKRQRKAWLYLFYSSLFWVVSGFLNGAVIETLVGAVIGWYVLFQVREYYK